MPFRVALALLVVAAWPGTLDAQRGTGVSRADLVGRPFEAHVVRVADGDTIEVVPAGEKRTVRIRLQGVDAPEQGEPFSREAQARLRTLVFDQKVRVEGRDLDRYGRLVARVWAAGQDASVELVSEGLACHAYARDAALAKHEASARSAGRGFWAPRANRPACVERTAFSAGSRPPAVGAGPRPPAARSSPPAAARVPAGYRGNVESKVYHASTCVNANCRNCTRVFSTEAEAKEAGFRPAGDCLKR